MTVNLSEGQKDALVYKTTSQNFDVKETRLNDHMNQMGQDGWELLSVVPPQYGGKFVFFGKP